MFKNMRIFYLDRINDFGRKHANARKSLATWVDVVLKAGMEKQTRCFAGFSKGQNDTEQSCKI